MIDLSARVREGLVLFLIALFAAAGLIVARGAKEAPRPVTAQATEEPTATLDPTRFSNPILDAQDAISRSLELFPEGHQPHSPIARLVSIGVMDAWRERQSMLSPPDSPGWVVGILGVDLTVADVLPAMYEGASDDVGQLPVDGAWFAWNANSGTLLGLGVLEDGWPQNYSSLSAMQDEQIPITAATEVILPTDVPTP